MNHYLKVIGSTFAITSSLFAIDIDVSGFGTIGGAISDKPYTYQRFINDEGTIKSNSLLGAQTDISLNKQWKITIQGKIAPSKDSDEGWDLSVPWAFLSYRPTNDWLIRIGKVRAPLYLNSQNMDIGVTYNTAKLPLEVYSLSPGDDGLGIIVTKTFEFDSGELLVDAVYGIISTPYRVYMRDDLSAYGGYKQGAGFHDMDITTAALSFTYETNAGDRFRAGIYKASVDYKSGQGLAGNFSLQPSNTLPLSVFYPFPYYQPDGGLVKNDLIAFTLGIDYGFGEGYRITSEYAMRKMLQADTGPNTHSAYATLSKNIGKWTPYITIAGMKAGDNVKELYANLNNDPVNQVIPINRHYADFVVGQEQKSVALGFTYAISPTQKIKAEWSQSRTGDIPNFLIDSPDPEPIQNQTINVFSLSYSMSF